MIDIEIEYDDETNLLTFFNDSFKICTTSVDNFNTAYSNITSGLQMGYLPVAVRGIFKDCRGTGETYIVCQQKPGYQMINYSPYDQRSLSLDDPSTSQFYLPMPWLLFVIKLTKAHQIDIIYGAVTKPNPDNIWDCDLYSIPTHNWYADMRLCRPAYLTANFSDNHDIFSLVNQAHNEIWSSGFNNDLHDTIDDCLLHITNSSSFCSIMHDEHRASLKKLWKQDRVMTYRQFYSIWADLDIETIINAPYRNNGRFCDFFWQINPARDHADRDGVDLDYISTLLMTAQNSSMD